MIRKTVFSLILIFTVAGFFGVSDVYAKRDAFEKIQQIYTNPEVQKKKTGRKWLKSSMSEFINNNTLKRDEAFVAKYVLAFGSYTNLKEASVLFDQLVDEVEKLDEKQLERVNNVINHSIEYIWLDIFFMREKYPIKYLDVISETFISRAKIYSKVEALRPLILITGDMHLILDIHPDNQKFLSRYDEIQNLQKDLAEKSGLGSEAIH